MYVDFQAALNIMNTKLKEYSRKINTIKTITLVYRLQEKHTIDKYSIIK